MDALDLTAEARALGRAKRLEHDDGTWMCWGCAGPLEPFHVSLHCEWCLAEHRRQKPSRDAARRREQMAPPNAATFASHSAEPENEVWERG